MLYTLVKSLHTNLKTKITVILLNPGTLEKKLRECGITVQVIDESQFNGLQIFQRLDNIIKQTSPDVIHTHRIKENILGSIAAWRNGIPSIRTTHGAPEHQPPLYKIPKHLILLTDRLLGRYCQQNIVAVSLDLASKLEHHFPKRKIKIIENGIDIASLIKNQPIKHPNNTDSYKIGIAGRLVPIKRIDLFIESAIYLKQNHPELRIKFQIYGDGPLQETLKTQIQSQQAANYIKLEGHCEKISEELQTLDALLMTSDHEGLPMILLEAMCLKLPIIAHAVGGIPHLLNEGQCGTLVHNHTAKAYAHAIINLIQQPEEYRTLAERAFDRVRKSYSAEHTANAYSNLYKKIIRT
ncbi:MAG: glycosyltransferase [Thiotrichaceae bacterium]|nr:glycosyltransferase [Thiotrichaceae bacterium]